MSKLKAYDEIGLFYNGLASVKLNGKENLEVKKKTNENKNYDARKKKHQIEF